MNKSKIDFWIRNLLVAKAMMIDVPNELIVKKLDRWNGKSNSCGTPACFGGLIARTPYFNKLGVVAESHPKDVQLSGRPTLVSNPDGFSLEVGVFLFGNDCMFAKNFEGGSDRDVINNRIDDQLEHLIAQT